MGARQKAATALLLLGAVAGRAQAPAQAPPQSPEWNSAESASPAEPHSDEPAGTSTPSPATVAADPPSRIVRLSLLQGPVNTEPAAGTAFAPAELNQVLTSGDRVITEAAAMAELQSGELAVRVAAGTDLTVTAMTDRVAQFGLANGTAHLRSYALPTGTVLELDSLEAAITVLQPGDVRVDEDAAAHATTVSVLSGEVQVDGPAELSQRLHAGERLRVHGEDPANEVAASTEPLGEANPDDFDAFSQMRDGLYNTGAEADSTYVDQEVTGSADLASYGSWQADASYGPVWFPAVAVDWRPYVDGHWRWVAPWGWTWVGHEPWAFAPFHYGRWTCVNGRWGWVPGTPGLRPVYAPALVAFVGGRPSSAGAGRLPEGGIAAWFPLGPGEAYLPPYRGSVLYRNRVNVSNLQTRNPAEARALYRQRTVDAFSDGADGSARTASYANRASGTVVTTATAFAGGQPVARHELQLSSADLEPVRVLAGPGILPRHTAVLDANKAAARGEGVQGVSPGTRPQLAQAPGIVAHDGRREAAEAGARPFFVRAPLPPATGAGLLEQHRNAERTTPGGTYPPLPAAGNLHQTLPPLSAREGMRRPEGGTAPAPTVRPAPARPAGEAAKPAAAAPAVRK